MGRPLGQHFLTDRNLARRLAETAGIGPADAVLEIGGGRGALTEHLVGRGRKLVVVELDETLADGLERRFGPAVDLRRGDFLELAPEILAEERWVVLGNLPYYVTSPILLTLCQHWARLARAVVMMQAEVADRLVAAPGDRARGRLSVAVQYRATVEWVTRIPPGAFRPPPKVESAVVRLEFRSAPAVMVRDETLFFEVVEHGFRWRRKTMASVLRQWRGWPAERAAQLLADLGLDPRRRAETLTLGEFAAIAAALAGAGG